MAQRTKVAQVLLLLGLLPAGHGGEGGRVADANEHRKGLDVVGVKLEDGTGEGLGKVPAATSRLCHTLKLVTVSGCITRAWILPVQFICNSTSGVSAPDSRMSQIKHIERNVSAHRKWRRTRSIGGLRNAPGRHVEGSAATIGDALRPSRVVSKFSAPSDSCTATKADTVVTMTAVPANSIRITATWDLSACVQA
jgi:hypothetical protein